MTIQGVAWEDLSVLLACIRHRSINQVSKAMRVSPSTVSRRLLRLEDTLGVRLFDRTPDGILPTHFALELEPHAELIEAQMADIERLAAGGRSPTGRVRLALPNGLAQMWLDDLPAFFNDNPGIDVDLVVGHGVVDLVRREADMALRFVRPRAPDLIVQKLGEIPMAPYVHPRLAGQRAKALRWLMFDDPNDVFLETRWIKKHMGEVKTMKVSIWNALFAAVLKGIGPALLSPLIAEPSGLVKIEGLPSVQSRELFLVYHRALREVPRFAIFRTWLKQKAALLLKQQ